MPNRRWLQFSLKTLAAVVVLIAAASSWYGHRLRLLEHERKQLAGKWEILFHGRVFETFDLNDADHQLLVPSGSVGRVDFRMLDGTGVSRGIYSWKGDEITVAQAFPNRPRPTSFEETEGVSIWKAVRRRPVEWWTDRSKMPSSSAPAPNPPSE